MTDGIHHVRRMEAPTWLNTWGAFWFVVLANAVVVYCFHTKVQARLETEALKKQDGDGFKICGHEDVPTACSAKGQGNGSGAMVGGKEVFAGNVSANDKSNVFSKNDTNSLKKWEKDGGTIEKRSQETNNHNGCIPVKRS